MKRYRIVERTNSETKRKYYSVQKKSFLGFWYNPLNIDAYTTGRYDSRKDAQDTIDMIFSKTTNRVIYERTKYGVASRSSSSEDGDQEKRVPHFEIYFDHKVLSDLSEILEGKLQNALSNIKGVSGAIKSNITCNEMGFPREKNDE